MAYIVGLLTKEEEKELERRGWDIEPAPQELISNELSPRERKRMKMVWIDNSMFEVMDGPDWEKG